jgi:hypothetical protein
LRNKPQKAIGIESGNSGWKKIADKIILAIFENSSAMSNFGPSKSLKIIITFDLLICFCLS